MKWAIVATMLALSAGAAQAEVVETHATGFRLKSVNQVAAPPEKVYAAIGEIGRWWNGAHSFGGDASKLSLALKAEGCFCEALPQGGSVRHGVVLMAAPHLGMVRIAAPLGPMQDEGVNAVMTFAMKAKDGGTELTTTFNVGGARDFIIKAAPGIDFVLTEAAKRLSNYAGTGKP
jgi:hypothetical protein